MPHVDEDLAVTLSVRCSIGLYQRLAAIAADNDMKLSQVVRLAADLGAEQLDGATITLREPELTDSSNGAPYS